MKYLIFLMLLLGQANKLSHNNKEIEVNIIERAKFILENDSCIYYFACYQSDTFLILSHIHNDTNFDNLERIEKGSTYKLKLKLISRIHSFLENSIDYDSLDQFGWKDIYYQPKPPIKFYRTFYYDSSFNITGVKSNFGLTIYPMSIDDEINNKLDLEKNKGDSVNLYLFYTSKDLFGDYITRSTKIIK